MNKHLPNSRPIPIRVVPVARLEPSRPAPPRILVEPAQDNPVRRERAYGAPLAAASRLPRVFHKTARNGFDAAVAAAGGTGAVDRRARRDGEPGLRGRLSPDAVGGDIQEPLILWEQPPQPRDGSGNDTPAWMIDPLRLPTEADYFRLASQVSALLGGFADFARSPGVRESGDWQARLPMPEVVLPETVLDMQISTSHARLRFETEHLVSRGVLLRYAAELQRHVKKALDDARVVEVQLW